MRKETRSVVSGMLLANNARTEIFILYCYRSRIRFKILTHKCLNLSRLTLLAPLIYSRSSGLMTSYLSITSFCATFIQHQSEIRYSNCGSSLSMYPRHNIDCWLKLFERRNCNFEFSLGYPFIDTIKNIWNRPFLSDLIASSVIFSFMLPNSLK